MAITNNQLGAPVSEVYNTKVGVFETGKKDAQGGAYEGVRFLALRDRKLEQYQVQDGVIIIGDRAFYDAKVKTVVLPEGLKAIGCSAFAGCKNLTGIALPEGLEIIKETAFRDCESLAELTLPSTLLEVGARAFGPGLKRLVILSENVTFSPDAFKQAKSLEEILVPGAVIGKYAVLFLAMGITAPLTEIKAEQEQEEEAIVEESTGNTTAATNKIDECANKIKDHLHELGMDEFVLYTYDYCGDLEWNEDFESLDSAVSLDLYFDLHESFNGEERTFIAPRKIKVDGDDLLIDLQEVKEYNEGEEEVLGYYESQSVDTLLERFETSDIEKCFTEILAHTFNSNVISLNQLEEEETEESDVISLNQQEEEDTEEESQSDISEDCVVKAIIKYDVEGEIFGKVVFVYDGQYCVDVDNNGDIDFEKVKNYTLENFDLSMCYELGLDADIPVDDCEQEIIDAFLSALDDEGELEYLDDPDSTYLEY